MNRTWIGSDPSNYSKGRLWYKPRLIVLHWMAIGDITDEQEMLQACDRVFMRPTREASTHFGIGGYEVHQYVAEEDTSWGAGNIFINRQAINIEHAGSPLLAISDETYETSSELIAHLSKTWNIPLDVEHIRLHREVSLKRTECPGNLDRDRIIRRAIEIRTGLDNPTSTPPVVIPDAPNPQPAPEPTPPNADSDFIITIAGARGSAYFRSEASTRGKVMAEYSNGVKVNCNGVVTGQSVNGSNVWYKSRRSGWFIHSSVAKRN